MSHKRKKAYLSFIVVSLVTLSFLGVQFVFASSHGAGAGGEPTGGGAGGEPTISGGAGTLENPLGNTNTIEGVIANIVTVLLGIVGVAALVFFIYGGIIWMTSAGNAERVRMGRETLVWATLGLAVVFGSYAVVNLILSAFSS